MPVKPALAGGPLLIAHRGGSALAPENTMAAFEQATMRWRADMIELDVRATADGRCIVIHDATVDRTTDGSGAVSAFSFDEIRALDAGYRFTPDGGRTFPNRGKGVRIPSIEEVLEQLEPVRLTIELKTPDAQGPLFEAIARAHAGDRIVAASERRAYRTRFGEWKGAVSAAREDALPFYLLHKARLAAIGRIRADVVQMSEKLGGHQALSPRLVRDLHAKGVLVHVWTVNEIADMHRLLDWGVDGLVTDYPDRLGRVLHERIGRPLPPG